MSFVLATSLAARLLPPEQRDPVLGDLEEQGLRRGSPGSVAALLGVAVHFHGEAWRDEESRLGALLSLTLSFALWWAVCAAGQPGAEFGEFYRDPLSRAAVRFWSAAHLPAALGAGLLIGHAPWVPTVGHPARCHVAFVLAAIASWGGPVAGGVLPAALLLAAAWLGHRARTDPGPSSTPSTA